MVCSQLAAGSGSETFVSPCHPFFPSQTINSSINLVIYCCVAKEFRTQVREIIEGIVMFPCSRSQQEQQQQQF